MQEALAKETAHLHAIPAKRNHAWTGDDLCCCSPTKSNWYDWIAYLFHIRSVGFVMFIHFINGTPKMWLIRSDYFEASISLIEQAFAFFCSAWMLPENATRRHSLVFDIYSLSALGLSITHENSPLDCLCQFFFSSFLSVVETLNEPFPVSPITNHWIEQMTIE